MPSWSNKEWSVTTSKASIVDSNTLETLESQLKIPMPEMVFGQNHLEIKHNPSGETIKFSAIDALDAVDKDYNGETRILQVAHTDKWKAGKIKHKNQASPETMSQLDFDVERVHNPYDWTYTTKYKGTFSPNFVQEPSPNNECEIPYDELKKRVPIEFYDDVQLYEDELGDFGLASYGAKIRVMPKCLFVLARFYMRLDNVAFRIRDVRLYLKFDEPKVLVQYTEKESEYDQVKQRIPLVYADDYARLFRDPNWVDQHLDTLKVQNYRYVLK